MTSNQLSYMQAKETQRHNLAVEGETHRANRMQESYNRDYLTETARSNLARETETHRSNVASEMETARSNRAREQQNYLNYYETRRSNLATEAETKRSNYAREAETKRSNLARETETNRANREAEYARLSDLSIKASREIIQGELAKSQIAKNSAETARTKLDMYLMPFKTIGQFGGLLGGKAFG